MSKEIHRFIDINSLPKKGKLISFKDSVGMDLYFEYNDKKDYVHIEAYDPKTHMLQISFPNIEKGKLFDIHSDNFKQVKFGNMIDDQITYDYKYKIGDVIRCNMGDITILDQETHMVGSEKNIKRRFYYIECNRCHNKRWVEASLLNKKKHQFCDKCGIHTYYPEKFLSNLLDQLNITYITQFNNKNESWCKNYLYDFFINLGNKRIIIETHGNQHYSKIWNQCGYTLEDVQKNDAAKMALALDNNITDYVVIDCRKSEEDWIKKSIFNTVLPHILAFDEMSIDWDKCHEFATSDFVRIAAEMYNNGYSTKEIEKELNRSKNSVRKYLETAYKLNLCTSLPNDNNFISISLYKGKEKVGDFLTLSNVKKFLKESYNIIICDNTIKKYMDTKQEYKGFTFYKYQEGECLV